ncbi:MAG: 3-dehydroquinate synthase [Gemmataceae bacterium]
MLRIHLGPRSHDIAIVSAASDGFGSFLAKRTEGRRTFIVTDSHLAEFTQTIIGSLSQSGFQSELAVVPAGEESKSISQATELWSRLAKWPADRQTVIVAFGGGVVGDLAGFVAATYARGLPLVMVPTSLVAMVDSAIGGKVGINLAEGKNLVGAIHQPIGIWIDIAALGTLPDREYRSGLAEVVKYGAAMDAEFLDWLEANLPAVLDRDTVTLRYLVEHCCRLKARLVEQDEREEFGLRIVLNYGHTFAHAFETASGYGKWLHGEAVSAGMICASRLAERLGLCTSEVTKRQVQLLERCGLPIDLPQGEVQTWLDLMRRDKKAIANQLRFVLPRRIGEAEVVDDTSEADVTAVLENKSS